MTGKEQNLLEKEQKMDWGRIIVAVLLPPLAVIDKGCGAMLIVGILWLFGWIPGVIAALLIGWTAKDSW